METSKNTESTTTKPAEDAGCRIDIRIESRGDVNIYNCTAPRPSSEPYPPVAPGNTCLPPVAGRKHKRSPAQKLQALAQRARVPSVLAASTLQLVRRHLAGKPAANALEQAAFARLAGLPAAVRSTLACAVSRLDTLPPDLRKRLFDNTVSQGEDDAVDPNRLAAAFGSELVQRAGLQAFGEAEAPNEERPGQIRVFEPSPEDFFTQVRICSVNSLRTQDFIPALSAGAYTPDEIAHDCTTTLVDGAPQLSCQVRTANCIGGSAAGVCLRVPTIAAGDGVLLQGVNFFSVDATVRLLAHNTGTVVRELDAHVVGDIETLVNETVDGQTRLVNDCRVHDRIGITLSQHGSSPWLLDADISGCFDNIDHGPLVAKLPVFTTTLSRWLKAGVVEVGFFAPTDTGTPQGGVVTLLTKLQTWC